MALGGVGLQRHDHQIGVDAVGDERLRAVHAVVLILGAPRARAHRGEIRADPGLGHRQRGDQRAVGDPRQPALALLLVAISQEVGQADVVVQRHPQSTPRHARVGYLLHHDLVEAEIRHPRAAVLRGHRHRQEPLLGGLREEFARHDPIMLPLLVVGCHLRRQKSAHRLAIGAVLALEDRPPHRLFASLLEGDPT